MPNTATPFVTFVPFGMNSSSHPATLGVNGVARMTNCAIVNQLATTRPGVRVFKMGEDAKVMRSLPFQGGCAFNPSFGQSQQKFAESSDGLVVAAGGMVFHLCLEKDTAVVSDETGDNPLSSDVSLVHFFQAEKYIIGQDGVSSPWIWDGTSDSFTSPGYNTEEPQKSMLAKAGSLGAYAHGRIIQVIDGSKIIVGDIIGKTMLDRPDNILGMTEQIYYATGAFFSPPSALGDVTAMAILPLSNTIHGHADVIIHCRRGSYSLQIDHFPRSEWPAKAVSKHMLLGTSASGPYSVASYDGDQIFRSILGIHTIRSAAASANEIGSPNKPISIPVECWIEADPCELLQYSSIVRWEAGRRILVTTGLWKSGRHRGGRGILSLNLSPDNANRPETKSWDGLWTFPEEVGLPNQIIEASFSSGGRVFFIATKTECDGSKILNLVEIDKDATCDRLEDGTEVPIVSQVIVGEAPLDNMDELKSFHDCTITFRNVEGEFYFGVWVRREPDAPWEQWGSGSHPGASLDDSGASLASPRRYILRKTLGRAPEAVQMSQRIQLLIRWRGYAQLQDVTVGVERDNSSGTPNVNEPVEKVVEMSPQGYTDWENTGENEWQLQV